MGVNLCFHLKEIFNIICIKNMILGNVKAFPKIIFSPQTGKAHLSD